MRRWIPIIVILLAMALAQSRMPVSLGGGDSLTLLKNLSNNSSISSEIPNGTNTTIDISQWPPSARLGGEKGMELFRNLTNGSSIKPSGATDNLSTWGSKPRSPPPPPKYDARQQQFIQVIKDNHIA